MAAEAASAHTVLSELRETERQKETLESTLAAAQAQASTSLSEARAELEERRREGSALEQSRQAASAEVRVVQRKPTL